MSFSEKERGKCCEMCATSRVPPKIRGKSVCMEGRIPFYTFSAFLVATTWLKIEKYRQNLYYIWSEKPLRVFCWVSERKWNREERLCHIAPSVFLTPDGVLLNFSYRVGRIGMKIKTDAVCVLLFTHVLDSCESNYTTLFLLVLTSQKYTCLPCLQNNLAEWFYNDALLISGYEDYTM